MGKHSRTEERQQCQGDWDTAELSETIEIGAHLAAREISASFESSAKRGTHIWLEQLRKRLCQLDMGPERRKQFRTGYLSIYALAILRKRE